LRLSGAGREILGVTTWYRFTWTEPYMVGVGLAFKRKFP